MYENGRPFELKYSKEKGFHLLTTTTVWDFVVKGVTGLCFSVPKEIAAVLDSYFTSMKKVSLWVRWHLLTTNATAMLVMVSIGQ
jgi:hypothetical protein